MKTVTPDYSPVFGKTYTLFGESESTLEYYNTIRIIADEALAINNDLEDLVEKLALFSTRKRSLKRILKDNSDKSTMASILRLSYTHLKRFTENAEEHLRTLPVSKRWDRRLATSREQYHLYMLEIELTNRLNIEAFRKAGKRIALLPYCLQDFSVKCKAEKNGFDYQCKQCSGRCFQNKSSAILRDNGIEPYIWMGGSIKKLAESAAQDGKSFGVLGIACIPELTFGMRNCRKNNIPVIGVALNANRCYRWFGEIFPNSVDLSQLSKLVSGGLG